MKVYQSDNLESVDEDSRATQKEEYMLSMSDEQRQAYNQLKRDLQHKNEIIGLQNPIYDSSQGCSSQATVHPLQRQSTERPQKPKQNQRLIHNVDLEGIVSSRRDSEKAS